MLKRALLFTVLAVSATAADSAGHCSGNPRPFAPGAGDWNGWGADPSNSRYQAKPGLVAADIPKLKVKWAVGFPNDMRAVGQPAVLGGRVFVGSQGGTVYSLDASTGCIYWSFDAGGIVRTGINVERVSNQWIAYFGDGKGIAHALDAQTGMELWKVKLDEHPLARVTGTPVFLNGRLYFPLASGEELGSAQPKYECCTFRGSMSALDAKTGRVIWKTYTVPDPAKQYKTLPDGTKLMGPAGAGLWSAPTIDEKRKRIYIGSGNSYTGIDIHTSDSIIAFDLETGALLWASQITPNDNWIPGCPKSALCPDNPGDDFDFGSSTILRSSGGKSVLVATQKSGVVYGLDPDDKGKILWKTRLGVGTGLMGGIAWGAASDDQNIYAAISDVNRPDGMPGLYALRIGTGEKVWSTPAPKGAGNPAQAAAVTAMPGVVFSSSLGGHLRAYSAKTGEIVWDFNAAQDFDTVNQVKAKGGSFNGSGPAISRGMVFATSGYGFAGGTAGNVLLAFSVDGK